jgi:hypothetical protein
MGKDRNLRYMFDSSSGESTTQAKHPFSIFLIKKALWFGRMVFSFPNAFNSIHTARPFSLFPIRSDIPAGAERDFKYFFAFCEYVALESMTSTSSPSSKHNDKTFCSTIFSGVIHV